jgi:hypothetical protein
MTFRQFIFSLPALVLAAPAAAAGCDYDITVADPARIELAIALRCEAGITRLTASSLATARIADLVIDGRTVAIEGTGWPAGPGAVTASYRIALGDGGAERRGFQSITRAGSTVMALLDAWLVRPAEDDAMLRLHARTADGFGVALPLQRTESVPAIRAGLVPAAGYTAFGPFVERRIALPGPGAMGWNPAAAPATLRVVRLDGATDLSDQQLFGWIERAAQAVARYWRGFPVAEALIIVVPMAERSNIVFGRVVPGGGISVMLQVGAQAGAKAITDDWVLIHELTHTAAPFMPGAFWLMEGMATYIEPIVRARAGWLAPEAVWAEFVRGMPRGLEAMGRTGLQDAGHGGIYWGGGLFMLLADAELRRASQGRRGLEDCLIEVLRQGGDATQRWTPDAFIRACDRATGTRVLATLAERHRFLGTPVDLAELWGRLGVAAMGDTVRLVDAPEAWLRDAILWGGPNGPLPTLPPLVD